MITQIRGFQFSEAAQWRLNRAKRSSFPALKQLYCRGFLPFIDTIQTPLLVDAKYEWYQTWDAGAHWGTFHPRWLNPHIQRLHLKGVTLNPEDHTSSYEGLNYLRLDYIEVVGPLKPWLLLPNLHTLVWKLSQSSLLSKEYIAEVLSKDGIFGSMGNLHTLELHSFPFKEDDPHIARIPHQILLHDHLKCLRMESCDIQNSFIENLLGNQEVGNGFLRELEELSFIRCNLEAPLQIIRARISNISSRIVLSYVPME
ncbi:hypothetical protein CPB86DRAFT_410225 [Serendipita vermifera]|nr:hypothetical protein CPB86DRAFT_410225 [Serendipita vermifera]